MRDAAAARPMEMAKMGSRPFDIMYLYAMAELFTSLLRELLSFLKDSVLFWRRDETLDFQDFRGRPSSGVSCNGQNVVLKSR